VPVVDDDATEEPTPTATTDAAAATDGGSSSQLPDPDDADTLEERRRLAVARVVSELGSETPRLETVVARTAGEWSIDPGVLTEHIRSRVDDGVYQIHHDGDDEVLEVIA